MHVSIQFDDYSVRRFDSRTELLLARVWFDLFFSCPYVACPGVHLSVRCQDQQLLSGSIARNLLGRGERKWTGSCLLCVRGVRLNNVYPPTRCLSSRPASNIGSNQAPCASVVVAAPDSYLPRITSSIYAVGKPFKQVDDDINHLHGAELIGTFS